MVGPARPRAGHHDGAFPALLQPAPDQTCHRREVHAHGGNGGADPDQEDPAANEAARTACAPTRSARRATAHDGTWSHPRLWAIAKAEFDAVMKGANRSPASGRTSMSARRLLAMPTAQDRGGCGRTWRWARLCRGVAARHGLRAAVQPGWRTPHRRRITAPRSGSGCACQRCRTPSGDERTSYARSCASGERQGEAALGEEAYAQARYEDAAQYVELVEQTDLRGIPDPAGLRPHSGRREGGGVAAPMEQKWRRRSRATSCFR